MVKLILVETEESFELFDNIEKAFNYCKEVKNIEKIDLVDCNKKDIFYEDDVLNYNDTSSLIKQGILSDVY